MSCVVGIDLSSRAIDLVRLEESVNEASWLRVELDGVSAWDRVRGMRAVMPHGTWWDDVYLVAIERPFAHSRNDVVRLAEGAVLSAIPTAIECWEINPTQWKTALGIRKGKPDWSHFPSGFWRANWPQDALDALGVALYARELNASGIAKALAG